MRLSRAGQRRAVVADRRQAPSVPRDRHADRVGDPSRARRLTGSASRRAPALSAWLGLTPSLHQSGESSRQGSITKTGSMLARRLLVESAWHYSRPPRLGATLANRQAGQPDHILQISNRAQQRLHTRQPHACEPAASRTTSPSSPAPASWPASSGPPPPPTNPARQHSPVGGPGRRAISGRHARHSYEQHPPSGRVTLVPRQRKPAARNRALGYPTLASSDWQRRHRARRPGPPTTPLRRPPSGRDHPRPLDKPSGHISCSS